MCVGLGEELQLRAQEHMQRGLPAELAPALPLAARRPAPRAAAAAVVAVITASMQLLWAAATHLDLLPQEDEELQQQAAAAEAEGMESEEEEEEGVADMDEDRMPGTDLALYGGFLLRRCGAERGRWHGLSKEQQREGGEPLAQRAPHLASPCPLHPASACLRLQGRRAACQWCFMRTRNTTPLPRRHMAQAQRHWCRRRMHRGWRCANMEWCAHA